MVARTSNRNNEPHRILHIHGQLSRAGVGLWLLQTLRHIDRKRFKLDFLTFTYERGDLDREVERLGSKIIRFPLPANPLSLTFKFIKILRDHGPYDAVHCHCYYSSGLFVLLAFLANIPVRIVHSRSAVEQTNTGLIRKAYLMAMRFLLLSFSTHWLAVSRKAAMALFGPQLLKIRKYSIVGGIELDGLAYSPEGTATRRALGIPADVRIIAHVGRFEVAKNHSFLVRIAENVSRRRGNIWFLLVGDGSLRKTIEEDVKKLGIADRFVFAGTRSDVLQLMKITIDALLLPSIYEGLPRVLLEAQAAGVPSIISNVITEEADLVKPLISRLSLDQPPSDWADALFAVLDRATHDDLRRYAIDLTHTPYNSVNSVKMIERIYAG